MATELELLDQIAKNTGHSDSLWVAIIAGGSAVLGAILGALISYLGLRLTSRVEVQKLKTSVVTTERLRWLQDIRQRVSHLYRQLDMQYNLLKRPVTPGQYPVIQKSLDDLSAEIMEQCNVITFMLNPNKTDQATVRNALQKSQAFMLNCFTQRNTGVLTFNDQQYAEIKQEIFDAVTSIGIQTWNRIKNLE